ncbi:MAG: DMT family transporter [Nitrospiraceae bacterium]|nr:DMT family transporter [Nitrospiraceae bacterium]MSR23785.1 DMT family transporter [Nitrospiraceae bacterium]
MSKSSEMAAFGALTFAAVAWGGSIVAQKWALGSLSVIEISLLRGVGALALLVPLWWWQEGKTTRFTGSDLAILGVLSLGVLGNHLLTLFGLRYVEAAVGGVIIGAAPAITALLSLLLLRDLPFRAVALGCAVSFGGVALVSSAGSSGGAGANPWLGGVLVVLAQVCWALYSIGGRHIMERFSPLTVNWTTLAFSLLPQIPLLWTDQKAMAAGMDSVVPSAWLAVTFLIIVPTALGQQAWLYGVKGVGPSRAGIFINLIPVSALLLSVLILGETLDATKIAGIVLILTGVWLVNWQSARYAAAA